MTARYQIMSQGKSFWNRKTYCLITGASQGIGREISIQFAKNVAPGSTFLLLARNLDNLNETKSLMEKVTNDINVFVHSFNFQEPIGIELHKIMNQSIDVFQQRPNDFEISIIVHNAGSLGDASELTYDMKNLEKLNSYFMLNLFSVCVLNSEFLKIFDLKKLEGESNDIKEKPEICVVNITSLCAIKPFASMGYYCIGKASREMYFGVMAEENKDYVVLNYSPGPVLTDMTDDIISNIRNDEMKEMYVKMKKDSTILQSNDSIAKLVKVLGQREFSSGSRVDYYDV